MLRHVRPKSDVTKMYGRLSSSVCLSSTTYATAAFEIDGSIRETTAHSTGHILSLGDCTAQMFWSTRVQFLPPSLVTWIQPSSEPAHRTLASLGDCASENRAP